MTIRDLLNEAKKVKATGHCFDQAYDYMMKHGPSNKKLKLVHGLVMGQGPIAGKIFKHAWVENGDTVIDTSRNNIEIPKIIYYGIGNIEEKNVFRYDYNEVIEMSEKFMNKGPWEKKILNNPL